MTWLICTQDALDWECVLTDPVPRECPQMTTRLFPLRALTHLYKQRASVVWPASVGSPMESPNPARDLASTAAHWQITALWFTATRWQPLRGKPALLTDLKLNPCLWLPDNKQLIKCNHMATNDIQSMQLWIISMNATRYRAKKKMLTCRQRVINLHLH